MSFKTLTWGEVLSYEELYEHFMEGHTDTPMLRVRVDNTLAGAYWHPDVPFGAWVDARNHLFSDYWLSVSWSTYFGNDDDSVYITRVIDGKAHTDKLGRGKYITWIDEPRDPRTTLTFDVGVVDKLPRGKALILKPSTMNDYRYAIPQGEPYLQAMFDTLRAREDANVMRDFMTCIHILNLKYTHFVQYDPDVLERLAKLGVDIHALGGTR